MSVFRGSGVALVTPFHEDKSVNFEMLEYLVERQITNETDAIVVCGTTGEPATMSEKERLAVIKTVVAKTHHPSADDPVMSPSVVPCLHHIPQNNSPHKY